MIMELGDGQVSELPYSDNKNEFYEMIGLCMIASILFMDVDMLKLCWGFPCIQWDLNLFASSLRHSVQRSAVITVRFLPLNSNAHVIHALCLNACIKMTFYGGKCAEGFTYKQAFEAFAGRDSASTNAAPYGLLIKNYWPVQRYSDLLLSFEG